MSKLRRLATEAKEAAKVLAYTDMNQKNRALQAIADTLRANIPAILAANEEDIRAAEANGMNPIMVDRLRLTAERIEGVADAVLEVMAMQDPVGEIVEGFTRPNGMQVQKVRVPLGVVGIIFESRPNVTVDAAVLCLKAGNAAFLRGGKEAIHSNIVLSDLMREAVCSAGLPEASITLLHDTSRETANEMMQLTGLLDVLIPRGGAGLIRAVVENARVPVIETGTGNCHIYVDRSADIAMAAEIVYNAKTSRPSVCNAAESLLVHADIAEAALPRIRERLDEKGVIIYGCPRTRAILGDAVQPATEADYAAEYLDYKISCKVVDSLDEAIAHIARYSTGHSEAIITRDYENARRFTARVDSTAVYVNASTRFTDGGEFGQGAEIGISTQKLHARGPMGLRELCSVKYIVFGDGQVR